MSEAALPPRQTARSRRFWMRLALVASLVGMGLVIWASQAYLMRSFSQEQSTKAKLRATLYAGSIQSTVQRHAVVPLLLSRDPFLIIALRSGQFGGADERLATFQEELGSGPIFLLDAAGDVVAASDDRPRGVSAAGEEYFTKVMENSGTEFSQRPNETGGYGFYYSRKVVVDEEVIGVVVVNVDLGLHEEGWRLARSRVIVADSEDDILLASEPGWRRHTVSNVFAPWTDPSRVGDLIRRGDEEAGALPLVHIDGTPYLRTEVPAGFRNWRLIYFDTLDEVRTRVNSVVFLIIMVLALALALGFYVLSRRTRAESKRLKRESRELRELNRRLSTEIAVRQRVERNLKDAEQSLEQASKLAALGQMSAAVSHELNQPLAAMKTYLGGARLLLRRRRPEEALSSFQRIDDLIDRMGGITRQLKSYARKSEVELEPVDLRESVREALSMMAPQLGKLAVSIDTTLPSEPVVIEADPLRIEQIIVNLLRNAIDAVRYQEHREIKILLVEGETILLSVEDNGTGLADPDKLFEPFYTTKKPGEGLGLGLAISAGFAGELGGRLVARNAPGGGAVFELMLPRERSERHAAE